MDSIESYLRKLIVASVGAAAPEVVVNNETRQSASPSCLRVPKTIWGIDRWKVATPSKA